MHCSWTGCYTPLCIFGGSLVCGSCAGSTSSCPLRHPALHYVCMQSCGELTPIASHCTALCVEGCGKLTPTVTHCTALCGSLYGICRAVGQLSARSYSGCTRFLLVVFFFLLPFASFAWNIWKWRALWRGTGEWWCVSGDGSMDEHKQVNLSILAAESLGGELYGFQQGAECGLSSVCTWNSWPAVCSSLSLWFL